MWLIITFVIFVDVEQPPSYDSLFGKIKEAKDKSDGNVDFVNTCCAIICGSCKC
jgi:succinate dehydrogenase/fumarate reductase-like Fe-S protein